MKVYDSYVHNYCKIHPLEDLVYAGSGSVTKRKEKKSLLYPNDNRFKLCLMRERRARPQAKYLRFLAIMARGCSVYSRSYISSFAIIMLSFCVTSHTQCSKRTQ